jgi:hypothetical protein
MTQMGTQVFADIFYKIRVNQLNPRNPCSVFFGTQMPQMGTQMVADF